VGLQWPEQTMAEFNTLVGATHRVYEQLGGSYSEDTAPMLMQVASAVKRQNEARLRAADDTEAAVVDELGDAIESGIRSAA